MSRITIEIEIDPADLPEQARKDLEANAQLARKPISKLLADIIAEKLGTPFSVTPKTA